MTETPAPEPTRARRRLIDSGHSDAAPSAADAAPRSAAAQDSFFGRPPTEVSRLEPAAPHQQNHSQPHHEPEHPVEQADDGEPAKKKHKLPEPLLWAIDITVWVVAAIVLSTLLRLFVFQMFLVPSQSMENTLKENDRIAALKIPHFQRGDIVVFSDPGNWLGTPVQQAGPVHRFFELIGLLAPTDKQYLVKRAIALPGDRVTCCTADGRITVNGVALDESLYLKEPDRAASGVQFDITVPAGRIFVMGDNRYDSADSRYHLCETTDAGLGVNAFVPIGNIVGPVRAVIMPLGRTGHRALPTSVFKDVPAPGPAPDLPSISVTGGLSQTCHS